MEGYSFYIGTASTLYRRRAKMIITLLHIFAFCLGNAFVAVGIARPNHLGVFCNIF